VSDQLFPTVVFQQDVGPFHNRLAHYVAPEDQWLIDGQHDVSLVHAICGRVGIGRVRSRKGVTCGECRSAIPAS
jgi:hypothetical protein